MADEPANLLPRGVEYRGADPYAREAFAIVNTFMQRMRAKEVAGTLDLPTAVTIITGASIVAGQLQLTTATARVVGLVAGGNITLGSSVNVHSGSPTASGTTLTFPTKDVFVLSSSAAADSTISGTNCT